MPDHFTIVIRSGLGYVRARVAIAREIGHSALGHRGELCKHEWEADRFAAVNLICPTEFNYATRRTHDLAAISRELKVTRRLLDAYLHWEY
jgi:hypothetical protein